MTLINRIGLVLLLSFFVFQPAISQNQEAVVTEEGDTRSVQMPFNYQNIQVPRELWQTIKDLLKKDGASAAMLEDFSVLPVSVRVNLASEDRLVLRDSFNYDLTFIEGGGDLDLFDYVQGKGPFHIRFAPDLNSDGSSIHILYISDSPLKKMAGKTWGNGCGRIYNLTEQSELLFYDGMKVTSSRRHYLHLMAGTFLFVQRVDDRVYLSYIRVKDSRYPNFNCRNA